MPEQDNIISVTNLKISFAGADAFDAVKDLSFSVGRGKTLAVVGESGSGKSLTALALMGLLPAAAQLSGSMRLNTNNTNTNLNPHTIQNLRGSHMAMVFQEPMSSLNPVMSVGKQLREAILAHQPIGNKEGKALAISWLDKVQLPDPAAMYDRFPHQLSGGQKQRVMIAMAMCNHPALLIADEPTTALDVTVQQEVIRLMTYLQQEHGTAMIFITHDLALAATLADEVLVMYKGTMVEYGPAAEVLRHPKEAYTQALIACKPSPDKKGFQLSVVGDYISNAAIPERIPNNPNHPMTADAAPSPIISINHLKVWFPQHTSFTGKTTSHFKAVDDVSFTLNKGEVLGLVGESGCGKSTLCRCIMGLVPATGGHITYDGQDLTQIPPADWKRLRTKIQMIFQDPYSSLNPRMTIGDILMEPLLVHNIVPGAQLAIEAARLLDVVQLPVTALNRYPHQFSGGQRQRIGIARALALKPEVLICDESVSALDVSIQAQILNLLKSLQSEFQLTYLFISHDLSVVHYISDRVMVMHKGHIVESGDANQVLRNPLSEYTRRLIDAVPDAGRLQY